MRKEKTIFNIPEYFLSKNVCLPGGVTNGKQEKITFQFFNL